MIRVHEIFGDVLCTVRSMSVPGYFRNTCFAFLLLFWSVYLPLLCIEGKDMTTYKRITTTFQFRLNLSSDPFFNQTFYSRRNCPQI